MTMKCSREDPKRSIDFSAVRSPHGIKWAIVELLARRKNPMRQSEIEHWFRSTPKACIGAALTDLLAHDIIDAGRTSLKRHTLEYWANPARADYQ
jgi:hypothetical protein